MRSSVSHGLRLAAAAVIALVGPSTPAAAEPGAPAALQRVLDDIVSHGVVGAQARVTSGSRHWSATAGATSLGGHRPVPANGLFRIGSATKMFTATVVLQLVQEGKVSLDRPARDYLPVAVDGRITVRDLLQHTSGLHDYIKDLPLEGQAFFDSRFTHYDEQTLVADAVQHPPEFTPGSTWRYSNTNFLAAGLLIKQVTGQTWQAEVTNRIIRPLSLRSTSAPYDDPFLHGPHARGYLDINGGVDVTELNPSEAGAAGGIVSTTADLDRFLTTLTGGELLDRARFAEMTRALTAPDTSGYGLGFLSYRFTCDDNQARTLWGHSGGIQGYNTFAFTTLDRAHRFEVSLTPLTVEADPLVADLLRTAACA